MIATSDLLEQIKGLKARISRLGQTPGAPSLKEATLLAAATAAGSASAPTSQANKENKAEKDRRPGKEANENKEKTNIGAAVDPSASHAPFSLGNLGKLGWRARRILETGLDLTATLKQWQERGEHNEPGLDLVLHPEEFSETVALADGSLRLLGLFPESQAEQMALCEGLEIVLVHLRRRVAFWDKKWELVRVQQAGLSRLQALAQSHETSGADRLQNWRDCAGEIVVSAKRTGLGYWSDRSNKDALCDWATMTWNLGDLAARFGWHMGYSEKDTRSLVLGSLLIQIVHAQMPGYLHGKPVWEENDRNWYAQWHHHQTEELPEALKPWVTKEALSAEQKSILELLLRFCALQMSRPDRPGIGPLAALTHLEKNQEGFTEAHWRSLVSFVEKEGTLIEAGSLGAGLIWTADVDPKPSFRASAQRPNPSAGQKAPGLRALILGPVDAGSQPSQGPYWASLTNGFGGAVKELTGTKRARWHVQLLSGCVDHP